MTTVTAPNRSPQTLDELETADLRPIETVPFARELTLPEQKLVIALRKADDKLAAAKNACAELQTRIEKIVAERPALPVEQVGQNQLDESKLQTELEALRPAVEEAQRERDGLQVRYDELHREAQPVRDRTQDKMRALFLKLGVQTAQDVIDRGCTGLYAAWPAHIDRDTRIQGLQEVRQNMGGAGFGVTCYVGPDRYCLVHQTIGGLQQGQTQRHPDQVANISRDLTPLERGHMAVVESVRRREGMSQRQASVVLSGKDPTQLAAILDTVPGVPTDLDAQLRAGGLAPAPPVATPSPLDPAKFECPEHGAIFWRCRFCIAQLIIEGALQPELFVEYNLTAPSPIDADVLEGLLKDDTEHDSITVHVKVAHYERKLTRVK